MTGKSKKEKTTRVKPAEIGDGDLETVRGGTGKGTDKLSSSGTGNVAETEELTIVHEYIERVR